MAISQSTLQQYATRTTVQKSMSYVAEAKSGRAQTAFLSHSHLDQAMAKGLQEYLREQGWDVYIDWQDNSLPDKPDASTAQAIVRKIRTANWFLLLATANSLASRWCPWELGLADGLKPRDSIMIIPTQFGSTIYGNEYVALYRHLDMTVDRSVAAFAAGSDKGRPVRGMATP